MQLPPNVEFWLRVVAIGVPAISAFVVAAVSYRLSRGMANRQKELNKELALYQSGLQASLNKELENHKKGISKELEIHKSQLQAAFQTRFYEFQTRYSWIHQRRAEAIENLFSLAARVQNDLQVWVSSSHHLRNQTEDEHYRTAEDHFQEMINFFDEKRIYFDQETADAVIAMVRITRMVYDEHPNVQRARVAPELARALKLNAAGLIDHVHTLMDRLDYRFRKLLEAETPTQPMERSAAGPDSTDRRNT
jgi:hypothetical protein